MIRHSNKTVTERNDGPHLRTVRSEPQTLSYFTSDDDDSISMYEYLLADTLSLRQFEVTNTY